MQKHILSKSSYLKGLQCKKQLYLYKHYYHLQDKPSELQKAIFERGTDVGKLAQNLFPGGIDVSPKSRFNYDESVAKTKELISEDEKILYEAAFQFDRVLIISDIIVNDGRNWKIYEVKSSTSITDVILDDAAIQYYVIKNLGIDISDFSIIYINNQYVREGELEINSLFSIDSVLDLIKNKEQPIHENVGNFKKLLSEKEIPEIPIGEHCSYPYSCSFKGYCWKHIPENSIFDIANMQLRKKFELYNNGIIKIEDIPQDFPLSKNHKLQVDSHLSRASKIDKMAIKDFLDTLNYPLSFMDFESFQPAVPLYDKSKPYQQIPFQYSLHYKESESSELKHSEFLAETGEDQRISFVKNLLSDTESTGDILVYNKSFEISRLNELARDFPKYKTKIEEIIPRIKDLMLPFQKKYYYAPDMKGSYSIKKVLPILVPELNYDNLEIAEGQAASIAFEKLQTEDDLINISEIRNNLLEYCKLDTLALVRILEVLKEI